MQRQYYLAGVLVVIGCLAVSLPAHSQVTNPPLYAPIAATPDASRLLAEKAIGATKPIYGDDDRMDWGWVEANTSDRIKKRARASVALFKMTVLVPAAQGNVSEVKAKSAALTYNLCKDERFSTQLSASYCSGTLIEDDLVLTAGHCANELRKDGAVPLAKDIQFVFGYYASSASDPGATQFDLRQVYRGKKLEAGTLKPKSSDSTGGEDWALVRLDRKVPASVAEPVRQFRQTKISTKRSVYVIGYPSGLPLKYAGGAVVTNNTASAYFKANLDTFAGDSGAGVYDDETGDLVGVLVRGDTDYYRTNGCVRAYRCPSTGCEGEEVTRIETIKLP